MADVLEDVAVEGLPGNHHFFISFDTDHAACVLTRRQKVWTTLLMRRSPRLRARPKKRRWKPKATAKAMLSA